MASAAAQAYFNQQSPADQQAILASWNGQDMMDEWYANAVAAGAVPAGGSSTAPTTQAQAQEYAASQGWSEDFARPEFADPTIERWSPYFDPASGKYKSMRGAPGLYEKPTECPPGQVPSGPNETDPCRPMSAAEGGGGGGGGYGGGGGAGYGYGGPGTGYGGAPAFQYTPFRAPLPGETTTDPSYMFRLEEGRKALERSASAQGVLRTSGTLKDILDYGQQAASQEYGNIYNRGLQTWGAQYQGQKDAFAPVYGSWQTVYGGDLQKYLQREQNIYGLLNQPAPSAPYYG